MDRWQFSHGKIGVNAPSWLTFEVHRPYFDGGDSALTAIQARGPLLAARLFAAGDWQTPRFTMIMPPSFRHLLIEESRLGTYQVAVPTDLSHDLASPSWQMMADAYSRFPELDAPQRAGLAQWLLAVCLPNALLRVMPADLDPQDCADPHLATLQCSRAIALRLRPTGLDAEAQAALAAVIQAPQPSVGQMNAHSSMGYYLSRSSADWSAAGEHFDRAHAILERLATELSAFTRTILRARLLVRQVTHAERAGDLERAWSLLQEAGSATEQAIPGSAEQEEVSVEMWRRVLDRRVEIAIKCGDHEAEERNVQEGLKLDPYCVKMWMQAAQAAQRRGNLDTALEAYLTAARLGPFGTAFALLNAAECATSSEVRRVLRERAHRCAPRSQRTTAALVKSCLDAGDNALATMLEQPATGYQGNWHYRMYGAYFNLGESHSPCLYASMPSYAYEFALSGKIPHISPQRITPPAFRTNLVRESGMPEFAAKHPADLPKPLRTPQWEQLCEWAAEHACSDPQRQYLTTQVLFRLGFRDLVQELVPERPVAGLREPLEFYQHLTRALAGYAASVGGRSPVPPKAYFEMVDSPHCPLRLRLNGSVFGVVFAARESKSLEDAIRWRARAEEYLPAVLASDDITDFEKVMLESRFYRGVGFVPFMRGDRQGTIDDMTRAEELARAVPASTPWEEFLKRENLHACLESRSKEAFGLRDIELGVARTREFLALDPYDPKSHIELAEALSKQERYFEAAESYLRAARLGPLGTAIAYAMAGSCFAKAGHAVLAEDCFVQSIRIDPYAISAARGWRKIASAGMSALAHDYADGLEEWGAARKEQRVAG